MINKAIRRYYQNWLRCDDDTCCAFRTRQTPLGILHKRHLCTSCSKSELITEYDDRQLNLQLRFLKQLFNIDAYKNSINRTKIEQVDAYFKTLSVDVTRSIHKNMTELQLHIDRIIQKSGYAEGDMPPEHSEFFTRLSYFGISTIDADGRPWATMLVGSSTTFICVVSNIQLNVSAVLPEGDPFLSSVISTTHVSPRYFAGVGVDFSNRRRNKVAELITSSKIVGSILHISLITNESLRNWSKYITIRKLEYHKRHSKIGADDRNADNVTLNQECRNIINQA
ncbi:unnamed protein product, partial [Rotaria magnacalcarata]